MKKFLPIILLLVGAVVLIVAFLLVKGRNKGELESAEEETALLDVALNERPIVSLIPTSDGHYLKLKIEKIVINATSLDYELLYQTGQGVTQGVPGTVNLEGKNSFETELLLGSESSGKFRYDEGVERGTMTMRFRNREGLLLAKFESEFHLQRGENGLTSIDGKLKFILEKSSNEFFVVMEAIGIPKETPADVAAGPYGIFSSSSQKTPGKFDPDFKSIYRWDGSEWTNLMNFESSDIGIFIASS